MRYSAAVLTIFAVCVTASAAKVYTEDQKIVILISHVREMKGAVFIRNGKEYPAKEAAAHLEMKYGKAKDKVKTARQFIGYIASKSYLSGEYYMIKFSDGKMVRSEDLLYKKLKQIESGK
jgi:hypothetical protein